MPGPLFVRWETTHFSVLKNVSGGIMPEAISRPPWLPGAAPSG
ncbi:MAG: hypothetical protein QOC84_1941 [Bradyrhizobium sp.]|nr:hypothetical protein [Bradyrhizobium sp.]